MSSNLSNSRGQIPSDNVDMMEEMLVYDSLPSEFRYFIRNWPNVLFCGAISMNKPHFLKLFQAARKYNVYPYLEENESYPTGR